MNVFAFVIAMVLFIGGLALMAYSFSMVGFEGVAFVGGILAVGASIALPAHVLGRSDG
jgi:hypothetical protein